MATHQSTSEIIVHRVRPVDLQAKLYREIGISAVAAALEWSARRPQKPTPIRAAEIPSILRND